MSSFPAYRTTRALTVALWFGLIFALGASGFDRYFRTPLLERGDQAVNALQIDNAKYLRELHGNYSRFEFHHPGPAFFYVYAAGEWLFHEALGVVPSPGNAHLLASVALQSAFFALALSLLAVHLPSRAWLPFALVLAAVFFGVLRDPFVGIWPPYVLLMPFLCFLAACVSVASGRIDHLPFAVLSGGFLFHGHVAQPLFVGGLGGLALACAWWRNRQPGSWRLAPAALAPHQKTLLISAGLAGLFLLPLALDILTAGTCGNVATIIGTFFANSSDRNGLLQSLLYFLSFGSFSRDQDALFTELGPQTRAFFAERRGLYLMHALGLVVPLGLLRWQCARFTKEERRFLRLGYGFLGAAIVLCLIWGIAQAGGMAHFNGFFYYGVFFFGFLLGLVILTRFIDGRLPEPLAVALICCAAVIATWSFRPPRLTEEQAGMVLRRGTEAALAAEPSPAPKLLRMEHYAWPEGASIALDLKRRGLGVYTTPWWNFMFGRRHDESRLGPAPEENAVVWWLTVPEPGRGHPVTPDLSLFTEPAPLNPEGDEIRFSEKANGYRYLVSGLTAGNVEMAWTDLPRVTFLFVPSPAQTDVLLVFDAQSNVDRDGETVAQRAVVLFNGEEVGEVVVTARADVSVRIPRDAWNRAETAKLELRFPEARSSRTFRRPGYESWRAWGLWALRVEPSR